MDRVVPGGVLSLRAVNVAVERIPEACGGVVEMVITAKIWRDIA